MVRGGDVEEEEATVMAAPAMLPLLVGEAMGAGVVEALVALEVGEEEEMEVEELAVEDADEVLELEVVGRLT